MMKGGALKFDSSKPMLSHIPREFLFQTAAVLDFGAKKYGRDNWKLGLDEHRLLSAAMRHLTYHADGEILDPESGLPHLAHAACNIAFLLHFWQQKKPTDSR